MEYHPLIIQLPVISHQHLLAFSKISVSPTLVLLHWLRSWSGLSLTLFISELCHVWGNYNQSMEHCLKWFSKAWHLITLWDVWSRLSAQYVPRWVTRPYRLRLLVFFFYFIFITLNMGGLTCLGAKMRLGTYASPPPSSLIIIHPVIFILKNETSIYLVISLIECRYLIYWYTFSNKLSVS